MANAQLHVDFVPNKHGGMSLVLHGFRFVVSINIGLLNDFKTWGI
jgi:hypothetical protein